MKRLLLVVAVLLCRSSTLTSAAAAPWSGLIGFLQMVADVRHRSEVDYGEDVPLRKIVYAVQEQVLQGEDASTAPPPAIIYDSGAKSETTELPGDDVDSGGQRPAPLDREQRAVIDTVTETSTPDPEPDYSLARGLLATARDTVTRVRPYFLGRKLWYAPLWFSLYFIVYLSVLVIKSVARHRIHYPTLVPAGEHLSRRRGGGGQAVGLGAATRRLGSAMASADRKYSYRDRNRNRYHRQ